MSFSFFTSLSVPVRVVLAHELARSNGFQLLLKKQSDRELTGQASNRKELSYEGEKQKPDAVGNNAH